MIDKYNEYLKALNVKHRLRDPIYGFIWLTDKELKLIDTPLFQRLRRIHQLALTKYVYPSAEHSRFTHSLGAMHCATAMFIGICEHKETKLATDLTPADKIEMLKLLRYAALLHDIGHLPFSHAIEKYFYAPLKHDDISQYLIKNYEGFKNILDDDTPPKVASILSSKTKRKYRILHEIISGNLDADRADYLLRDSYFCGVKYGEFDLLRYSQSFGLIEKDNVLNLIINEDDIYVIESLLIARMHYNMQVPFHRTRKGFDLALNLYCKETKSDIPNFIEIKENQIQNFDMDFFEFFDDYAFFEKIKDSYKRGNRIAKILMRQGHLKCEYEEHLEEDTSDKINKITEKLDKKGLKKDNDYYIKISSSDFFKIVEPEGEEKSNIILVKLKTGDIEDISEFSPIIKKFKNKKRNIIRVYLKEV